MFSFSSESDVSWPSNKASVCVLHTSYNLSSTACPCPLDTHLMSITRQLVMKTWSRLSVNDIPCL